MFIQSIVLWSTLGLLFNAAGFGFDSWQSWCFIGLFWALSRSSREIGQFQGIVKFIHLSREEQNQLTKLIKEITQNESK